MIALTRNGTSNRIWRQLALALVLTLAALIRAQPGSAAPLQPENPFGQDPAPTPTATATATATLPTKPAKFDRIYDLTGRLNDDQYDRFHFDVGRMWDDGLPALIYIRESGADAGASQSFADYLRAAWDIESAPGADDGLVMLVTVRDRFPHTAILSLSYGANAFPHGQMTVNVLNDVVTNEVTPRVRVGNVNGGLTYLVRRILYYAEYTAPFPPPLTDRQQVLHRIAVPVSGVAITFLVLLIAMPRRRLPNVLRRPGWRAGLGAVSVAIAAVVAVGGRNALAAALAIAALLLLMLLLWLQGRQRAGGIHALRVTRPALNGIRRLRRKPDVSRV